MCVGRKGMVKGDSSASQDLPGWLVLVIQQAQRMKLLESLQVGKIFWEDFSLDPSGSPGFPSWYEGLLRHSDILVVRWLERNLVCIAGDEKKIDFSLRQLELDVHF